MLSSRVSTRTDWHSRVNALVSRNDFWRLFNARATGKICWNLNGDVYKNPGYLRIHPKVRSHNLQSYVNRALSQCLLIGLSQA